jgi:hypothetical protein
VSLSGHILGGDVIYVGVSTMLYRDVCGSGGGHVVSGDVTNQGIWYVDAVV